MPGNGSRGVKSRIFELKTFRPNGVAWVGPMAANANKVYLAAVGPNAGPQFVIAFDLRRKKQRGRRSKQRQQKPRGGGVVSPSSPRHSRNIFAKEDDGRSVERRFLGYTSEERQTVGKDCPWGS